jgi:hypothetical protein
MKVHHIVPGRSDLNFGESINDLVKGLPDEDWICLRDIDTMPLLHKEFIFQCEQIVKTTPYQLIGGMTNRIGINQHLYKGIFSEDYNLVNHKAIAQELFDKYGCDVIETKKTLAGFLLLFSVNTWKRAGGFPVGGIQINNAMLDYHFSKRVLKIGGKLAIAKGIYIFHNYRMGEKNPRTFRKHLTTKIN